MDPNEAKGRLKDYKNFGKDPEVSKIRFNNNLNSFLILNLLMSGMSSSKTRSNNSIA